MISLDGTPASRNHRAMLFNRSRLLRRLCLVLPLVLSLSTCASSRVGVGERAEALGVQLTETDVELVNTVLSRVVSRSLEQHSSTDMIDATLGKIRDVKEVPEGRTRVDVGINEALKGVDEYAVYLNEERTRRMRQRLRGNFEGVGIFIGLRNDRLTVISPIEGSPAMAAGLKPEDHISHVDGQPTDGLSVSEAAGLLRGSRGSEVVVTIHRGDDPPFDVRIVRALITVPSASSRRYGDIGYIRLTQFTENTEPGLEEEIDKLVRDPAGVPDGFILDLRNNPGGLTTQATAVSDAFLESGIMWSASGRNGERNRVYEATPGDLALGRPIVVLLNRGSASASEIVAGALRGNGRATLMGARTFGKGVAQTHFRLPDGGSLKLTTLKFFKPDGSSAQKVGIQPDIKVLQPDAEPDPETVPVLGTARGDSCPEVDKVEKEDHQLRCAIALLRTGGAPAFLALHGSGS
jgi:carboxyl-terminal processing protease